MTEEEMAAQRFVADADGIKIERPGSMPDWTKVLEKAKKEKQASD